MTLHHDHDIANLSPRELVVQAINLLQAKHGVSAAAAFEMMVQGSTASQDEIRDVAAEIVRQADEQPC